MTIATSTITMDTDCGRTPLEHLRAIEATANNAALKETKGVASAVGTIAEMNAYNKLERCRIRIELYNELIKLERAS